MGRFFAVSTLLLVLICGPVSKQTSAADDVERLLDAHFDAVGGLPAIEAVRTFRRTGTVSGRSAAGPFGGSFTDIVDLQTKRGYQELKLQGFTYQTGWGQQSGWIKDTQSGLRKMSLEEVALAAHNMGPSPLVAYAKNLGRTAFKKSARDDVTDDKRFNECECISVMTADTPMHFYVHKESGLLAALEIPEKLLITYAQHRPIEGIQFPGVTTVLAKSENTEISYSYQSTEVNIKVDQKIFEMPAEANSQPSLLSGTTGEQIISYFDKNQDGKISKDEANQELSSSFSSIDTNQDGQIDIDEATAIATYLNSQQSPDSSPAVQLNGSLSAEKLLQSMDKDGDRRISKTEASPDLKLFFADYDRNRDGFIDELEAKLAADSATKLAGSSASTKSTPSDAVKQALRSIDTDGDGNISLKEAPEKLKPHFAVFDTNNDGKIDPTEALALATFIQAELPASAETPAEGGKVTAAQIIASMDRNNDKKISLDESSAELKPNFSLIDTNRDGRIDVQEAQAIADYVNKLPKP